MITIKLIVVTIILYFFISINTVYADDSKITMEQHFNGLIDIRAVTTDSYNSYLNGGYGKFRYSNGETLSLAQLALNYRITWSNNISYHLVLNSNVDNNNEQDKNNLIGITESYLKYRSLPDNNGLRYQFRGGFMYPIISLENIATGWSSPYTLSYSTLNSWIAEEVRHLGVEASVSKLGKLSATPYDFTLRAVLFSNNDPNGAMLAWHGWTQSSRQTFWNESLKFPKSPALDNTLAEQARKSAPFKEVDSNLGYQLSGDWNLRGKGKLLAGYYDNRGGTHSVKYGQYAWITRFTHIGIKWKLANKLTVISQYIVGDTRMRVDAQNPYDIVGVNFNNAFIMLTKRWKRHQLSGRIEKFEVKEFDNLANDNNDEDGRAFTVSYGYKQTKYLFLFLEYNWISSYRPSRAYLNRDIDAIERQLQTAIRYYF